MIKAINEHWRHGVQLEGLIEAGLRWLSENPIVPNEADVMEILQERVRSHHISGEE